MKKYYNSPEADLVHINSGDCMNLSGESVSGIGDNEYDNVCDVSSWGSDN